MYWLDWAYRNSQYNPRLYRAQLSGEGIEILVDLSHLQSYYPVGLALDYREDRLYWIDPQRDNLHSVNLNGFSPTSVLLSQRNIQPHSLTLYNDVLYWSDVHSHSIESANKSTDPPKHLQNMGWPSDNSVLGIAIFHPARQPDGKHIIDVRRRQQRFY